jgi:hypothetical protein
MSHYTKMTPITRTIKIWAIPNSFPEPGEDPFTFEVRTDRPWATGAVMIHEEDITVTIPAGINLIAKAVETLEHAKRETTDAYIRDLKDLDKRIDDLKLIGYTPSGPMGEGGTDEISGELLEGEEG